MDRYAAGNLHGFPAALTSFVGRARVVDEVADLLARDRLVTVTGPGGAGKTRLAGEVGRQVAGRFADGVWLAELATVRDPGQVAATVAVTLGIRDLPSVAAADALAHALARRQLLLVLDNCEHVIGAAAELCGRLLLGADDARVLATSREPLRIAGEVRYRLGPLTLPDPGDLAAAARCEAVTLFADRARRVEPGFALNEKTTATVERLVARLDGMPLAIELAAARVDALGVTQLLDRIDDRFGLLADGDRLAEERQRSLAGAVRWSYQLLDDTERRVFRAVSVFPGPFTLDAAEAVAGTRAGQAVLRLVDCSLVQPPQTGPDDRARYGMLETLRAYGAGLLAEADEEDQVSAALGEYAAEMAGNALVDVYTRTRELDGLRYLDAEDVTMRHVLAWALEHDPGTAVRLALNLAPWWGLRGRLASQAPLLTAVAELADAGGIEWCAAHMFLAQVAGQIEDPPAALDHLTAARDALQDASHLDDAGGPWLLSLCLGGRSSALIRLGRIAEAIEDSRRALDLAREIRRRGAGGDGPGEPQPGRLVWRRPGRRAPARAPGAGDRGVRGGTAARPEPDRGRGPDRGRRPGRRRAGLRGRAGLVPGRGRPDQPVRGPMAPDDPGPADRPHRRRAGAPARAVPDRHADRAPAAPAGRPGLLRPSVRGHRAPGRGDHGVGRDVGPGQPLAHTRRPEPGTPGGTAAAGPGADRPGPDPGGRGTRHGHEPGHGHRVRGPARLRAGPAARGRYLGAR